MKSFIEVIKEADEVQAKLKFIQDPKSPTKSIAGFLRNSDPVIKNAAEEELKRRRDSGDQEAGASVQPPKDPSMHSATTQVGGDPTQNETKTKEVEPNNIAPSKKGSKGREILNNLAKGKTITGDTPNAIELNPKYIIRADGIKEEKAPGKTVVFSFGRMNPPTIGHEKLVKAIEREAKSVGGTPRLYLSRTEGDAKNPLPYAKKNKFAKLAFPIVKDTPNNMMPSGFIGLLKHLEDQFDDVVIVVGSDRLANIKKLAERYNGTEYKYNTIKVVSAGERDPDEEGAAGMSASKMRQAVKDGNMTAFKAGLPSRLKGVAKTIFDELSKSLEEQFDYDLDEAVALTLQQRLKRRAQFRRVRGKIRMGQRRALQRKANTKTISKRSKRIAIKLFRQRILRNRKYTDLSFTARQAVDRIIAKRSKVIARVAKRIEPKLRRLESSRKSGQGFKSLKVSGVSLTPKRKVTEEVSFDNLIEVVTKLFDNISEETRIDLTPLETGSLRKKSTEANESFDKLKKVFNRGVAAWHMGLRENSTPQQWGFARVNSFLANGLARRTADRDLTEETEEELLKRIPREEDRNSLGQLESQGRSEEVRKAAAERIKELDSMQTDAQPAAEPAPAPVQQQTDQQTGVVSPAIDPNRNPQNSVGLANGKTELTKSFSQPQQPIDGQPDREKPLSQKELSAAARAGGSEVASRKLYLQSSSGKKDTMMVSPGSPDALAELDQIMAEMKDPDVSPKTKLQNELDLNSRIESLAKRKTELGKVGKKNQRAQDERELISQEEKQIQSSIQALQLEGDWNNALRTESFDKVDSKQQVLKGDKLKSAVSAMIAKLAETKQIAQQVCVANKPEEADASPGKPSSNLGELASITVVADILSEGKIDPSDLDQALPEIARRIFDLVGDGNSGFLKKLQNTGGEKISKEEVQVFRRMCKETNVDIPPTINDTQLKHIIYAHKMAYGKLAVAHDDLNGAGMDPKNAVTIGITGSARGKKQGAEMFQMFRDNGITHINSGNGRKIPIDLVESYALGFGGGDNPADTVLISIDKKTGQPFTTFFSDKQDTEAQFGNTTLLAMSDSVETRLLAYKKLNKLDEAGHKEATQHLITLREKVQSAASRIQQQDFHFADRILKGDVNNWIKAAKNVSEGSYYNKMESLYDPDMTPMRKNETKIEAVLRACKDAAKSGDKEMLQYLQPAHEILARTSRVDYWKETPGHAKEQIDNLDKLTEEVTGVFGEFGDKVNKIDPNNDNLGQEIINHVVLTLAGAAHYYDDSLSPLGDPSSAGMFHTQYANDTMTHEKGREIFGGKKDHTYADLIEGVTTKSVPSRSKEKKVSGLSMLFGMNRTDGENIANIVTEDSDSISAIKAEHHAVKVSVRGKGEAGKYAVGIVYGPSSRKTISSDPDWRSYYGKYAQRNESFLSFGEFLEESADKAVGNVPVISAKPIHHKASGHKYHIHHMINPDIALKHQVKHATQRFDRDVDSDIDQFDKPSAKFPDEVSVPTKDSTAKFFAKYKKEREHIHAGEPIDEKIVFSEGPLSPIPKTDKPNLFHGNYGGKGNRGGEPVDKLDQAFQKHDTGYHDTPDSKKRLKHDKSLVKATSSIAKDKSQPIKTRVKAGMATALFKTKLALKKKKKVDEQKETPKYTGDENSWYLDAYGQKVRVFSQADLKWPENVDGFLKKPFQQKDIGKMMSMDDFLKTQPEKKK